MQKEDAIYSEELSSSSTETLFITFTVISLLFSLWHWKNSGQNIWTVLSSIFFILFVFYSLNYRTLKIRITSEVLQLSFGIIIWKVATVNIDTCYLDETSMFRIGGAGLHFTWIKGKYRAFFNFLEYPRVVVALRKKHGVVREIAFSTRQPKQVMESIRSELLGQQHTHKEQ